MADMNGSVTPAQYEILEAVWHAGEAGSTVAEIWQAISERRSVTRTTVLNQVDRLEKRGWLKRRKQNDIYRYFATRSQAQVAQGLVAEFVDSFFQGSAAELVMNLLGSKRLKSSEVKRLRDLLEKGSEK